ncbi:hypothetical protein Q9290_05380 [Oceanimonas sp. CHS3-5]|uniref:hypothetical protein n=1 Tax=Oceanimonas sp. CHS3-5 TaxID=3068186 RepID=UPI00273E86A5|nr:hypothetical protein [Oceanimonas sp. CHS3-5]MDP5291719.1 hypothetical protein [Oceanimonas sp. CHS3-5]
MNTSAEVDEQQREKAAREQAMFEALNNASVVYDWSVRAPMHLSTLSALVPTLILMLIGVAMAVHMDSVTPFLLVSL